jgi:hypothetical protein
LTGIGLAAEGGVPLKKHGESLGEIITDDLRGVATKAIDLHVHTRKVLHEDSLKKSCGLRAAAVDNSTVSNSAGLSFDTSGRFWGIP